MKRIAILAALWCAIAGRASLAQVHEYQPAYITGSQSFDAYGVGESVFVVANAEITLEHSHEGQRTVTFYNMGSHRVTLAGVDAAGALIRPDGVAYVKGAKLYTVAPNHSVTLASNGNGWTFAGTSPLY